MTLIRPRPVPSFPSSGPLQRGSHLTASRHAPMCGVRFHPVVTTHCSFLPLFSPILPVGCLPASMAAIGHTVFAIETRGLVAVKPGIPQQIGWPDSPQLCFSPIISMDSTASCLFYQMFLLGGMPLFTSITMCRCLGFSTGGNC